MPSSNPVQAALDQFDRTFASGDAAALAELFAVDARLLLLHREPLEGRPAILEHWTRLFAEYDPASWRAEHDIVEIHDDRAYALSLYSETLVDRRGGPSLDVLGRLILFLRRDPDHSWRVTLAMNSHTRPVEQRASEAEEPR
jgi:uncharacterized protein (TIGR02246 family)